MNRIVNLTLGAFVAAFLAAWLAGVKTEGKAQGWATEANCTDGCERGHYRAHYRYLECRYPRLGRSEGSLKFLIHGWKGDTDIAPHRTQDGAAFPPKLPPYRQLTAEEIALVEKGAGWSVCPWLYDGASEAAAQ